MYSLVEKLTRILAFILIFTISALAQSVDKTLNASQIIEIVRSYHPMARQAQLKIEMSKADVTIARGGFDPIFEAYLAKKTFDGTNYYNQTSPSITIPTWYGIEVYSGIENYTGKYLDPTKSKNKTGYFGISIPLAKDLLMDERRASLKQAKIMNTMAFNDQKSEINNLIFDAMETYWSWVKAYQSYVIISNGIAINESRFELVKKSFLNGEKAEIDTVEALTQLQSFQTQQKQYWLEFQNTGIQLSAFLWQENDQPFLLPDDVLPSANWENEINLQDYDLNLLSLLKSSDSEHPDLKFYDYKLSALEINKNLKFQKLLPKADFNYNFLGKGYKPLPNENVFPFFENNYQYGFKFGLPLRLSEGRGAYRSAKIKIEQTQIEMNQKKLEISIKIKSYYNSVNTLREQIAIQEQNLKNYQQLVRAEEIRFQNGESSLFVINSRENKLLDAQEKLISLKTKYFNSIYALQWSAGQLK